jgi:hypothetical protein
MVTVGSQPAIHDGRELTARDRFPLTVPQDAALFKIAFRARF